MVDGTRSGSLVGFRRASKSPVLEQVSFDVVAPDETGPVLILLHGAITSGEWIRMVDHYAQSIRSPIKICGISPGWMSTLYVLFGADISKLVHEVKYNIDKIIAEHPERKISIACHSFGTFIFNEVMKTGIADQIENVFLLGSIIRQQDINQMLKGTNHVICDCSTSDFLAIILETCIPLKYERTSLIGFNNYHQKMINRRFKGGHSQCVTRTHFEHYIFPALIDPPIKKPKQFPKLEQPDNSVILLRFALALATFLILGIIGVQIIL